MREIPSWWQLWYWLSPDRLQAFVWAHSHEWWLWAILLLVLLAVLLAGWLERRPVYIIPALSLLEGLERRIGWGGRLFMMLRKAFFLLSLVFFFLALARPQQESAVAPPQQEGIAMLLVLDVSASMQLKDFLPNRLFVVKSLAEDFVVRRRRDLIGLVVFAGDAITISPLTTDYVQLQTLIQSLDFRMVARQGTAIGTAIGVAVNRLRVSTQQSKVIVLLSDGDSNTGTIDPQTAALIAHQHGIRIYSILIGKEGKVLKGYDAFKQPIYVDNTIDMATMQTVAELSGGKYFRATDADALRKVFEEIDRLEKSPTGLAAQTLQEDQYLPYLHWGICCLLLWLGMGLRTFPY